MKRITEIWLSFRALPMWVQLWIAFILVPVNVAGLFFLDTPQGQIAAVLSICGMLPNVPIIWFQRGFSRVMAFPHLPIWTPLVIWLAWVFATNPPEGTIRTYFIVLLIVDTISLAFDYLDVFKYVKGDRAVVRPEKI